MGSTLPCLCVRIVLPALACFCLGACSNSAAVQDSNTLTGSLPPIAELDSLRHGSLIQQIDVDVTAPLLEQNTLIQDLSLAFPAPNSTSHAWAVYRMGPIEGDYTTATAMGTGELWIMAADYGAGYWRLMTKLAGGSAVIDLSNLTDWLSPLGYTYLAAACPIGNTGQLDSLIQEYDTVAPPQWDFNTSTDDNSLTITWSSGMGDSYDIYRSTLSGDPLPYLVGRQADSGGPDNEFTEQIGIWPGDSTWLPDEVNSGINGDETDFYPSVAPEVDYYYTFIPVFDTAGPGDPSPEVNVKIDWGMRRTTRRQLPDSSESLVVFADQLRPDLMTDQQVTFCANNFGGTQKIFRNQADLFRAKNNNFIVLGYHLGLGAGNIGNVHGNDWDDNADWPYIDAHEDWFIHDPESVPPAPRVLQNDWNWYAADPASAWQNYLGANLLQMLGEDHFDGWFIDSCSELWNTTPAKWWPGADDPNVMFEYWTPRVSSCLLEITQRAKAHPLQPYVVPNAGPYITTISDIKYYDGDHDPPNWQCDGIMIEGYGRYDHDNSFTVDDWKLECNRILDHEAHGLAVILQCSIWTPDTQDRMFQLATYYLVKGDQAYVNWLGDDGLDTIDPQLPQWYPEWDWTCGAGSLPGSVEELADQGIYSRTFANGKVLVNPTNNPVNYNLGMNPYQYMVPIGGGNVDADGNKQGSVSWQMAIGSVNVPAYSGMIMTPL